VKSGVLSSRKGADEIFIALAALKRITSLEVNTTCGVHVHVGDTAYSYRYASILLVQLTYMYAYLLGTT
jgi:hypothetical protein